MNLLNQDQVRILERLKTCGALSVDDISTWLRKPKTAVRRTLLTLEKKEILLRTLVSGQRGRPTLCFKLGQQSKQFFPSKDAEILTELVNYMIKTNQRAALEIFFFEHWEKKYVRVMAKVLGEKKQGISGKIQALKEVLNEDGFYARSQYSKKKAHLTIRECHCPISAVAASVDIPCKMEARLISRVLQADCVSVKPMSPEQKDCVFEFKNF